MQSAVLFSLAAAGAADFPTPTGKTHVNDENLIAYYNSVNGATWQAGHNEFFSGMTFDDVRPLLGTALSDISAHMNRTKPQSAYDKVGEVPTDFDATTKWEGLMHPIRNQLQCGSCWAFSASEVLSDRVAIAAGKSSPVLSPEDMVSCDQGDMGCQGGMLDKAWNYLEETGIVTDACFPYGAGDGTVPKCVNTCADGSAFTRTKASNAVAISGVENMQKEMMTNGPIQVAFMVYKSFMSYKTGVYTKHIWELLPEGGHAVKMVGWGSDDSMSYWKVANSWDTTWGEEGYFRIKRAADECGIETRGPPYAGMPAASSAVVAKSDIEHPQCSVWGIVGCGAAAAAAATFCGGALDPADAACILTAIKVIPGCGACACSGVGCPSWCPCSQAGVDALLAKNSTSIVV